MYGVNGGPNCTNAFRDVLLFVFRNETGQPIDQILTFNGSAEVGYYDTSQGTSAPTQGNNLGTMFFSTPIALGETTEILWVSQREGTFTLDLSQTYVGLVAFSGGSVVGSGGSTLAPPVPVPEPTTASLLVLGLLGLAMRRRV